MTIHRTRHLAFIGLVLVLVQLGSPSAATAQPRNNNNSATSVPTQSAFGLASLAGGLALAGSWLVARRDRRK